MLSDYRFSPPLVARMSGFLLAAVGFTVFLLTLIFAVFSLPMAVLTVGLAVAGVAVAAVLAVGIVLTRRSFVVRLDVDGYRVRLIRGAGVRRARWKDVEDVVATTVAGERCVVLRLRDGRTTTLPLRALAGSSDAFVQDLQAHLNQGHGYRRLG